jgi:hypothetical protein
MGKKPAKKKAHAPKTSSPKPRKLKCCHYCQDYKYCKDRKSCCEYCDFLVNNKCIHGKKGKIVVGIAGGKIQLDDYRGDAYGIDDYSAYEVSEEE